MNEPTLPFLFTPRSYQAEVEDAFQRGIRRFITVWPRGGGKDNFWLNFCACRMAETSGIYKHIFPEKLMGRNNWWNEYSNDGFRFLDHFPRELCLDNGRRGRNESEMSVTYINGAVYQVMGADEPDRLRGGNPAGVIFSEYAWCSQLAWPIVEPRILARKGWAAFNSTPDGRDRSLYALIKAMAPHLLRRFMGATLEGSAWAKEDLKDDPEWFVSIQTNDTVKKDGAIWKYDANDDRYSEVPENGGPIYLEADIERMRKQGRTEDWIAQEIFCSFNGSRTGSYYGQWMVRARTEQRIGIGKGVWDPRYGVSTIFDLGFTDSTSIWFMQKWGPNVRLIDYEEDSGKEFGHYAKLLREKPYRYNSYWAPHDVKQRHLSTGKSTYEVAREMGIYFNLVPEVSFIDGVNAVRALLPRCTFEESKCAVGIEALERYRSTENRRLGQFETAHPVHDSYSHGADAFRYLALIVDQVQDGAVSRTATQSDGDFDVFNS